MVSLKMQLQPSPRQKKLHFVILSQKQGWSLGRGADGPGSCFQAGSSLSLHLSSAQFASVGPFTLKQASCTSPADISGWGEAPTATASGENSSPIRVWVARGGRRLIEASGKPSDT